MKRKKHLTPGQSMVLDYIKDHSFCSCKEIFRNTEISSRSVCNYTLFSLLRMGLIEKHIRLDKPVKPLYAIKE